MLFVINRCSMLRALSFCGTAEASGDVWALSTASARLPHLQQLSLQLSGRIPLDAEWWQTTLPDQQHACAAVWQNFGRAAPALRVFSKDGIFLSPLPFFTALRHLTLDGALVLQQRQ